MKLFLYFFNNKFVPDKKTMVILQQFGFPLHYFVFQYWDLYT